ncbi:MAG: glycosyltransferase [Acidobacteriota bacterium]
MALLLWIWTGLAAVWWLIAYALVARSSRFAHVTGVAPSSPIDAPEDRRRLTVFKPLASPMGERELQRLRGCLASFAAELDEDSEMLIGCHERDEDRIRALVDDLGRAQPSAELKLVSHARPRSFHANPKVSWMRILTPHATGELWLWSDSDMTAPAGLLRSLRCDLAASETGLLTSAYRVSEVSRPPELLDALYVNLEFYPGVMLLARADQIRFGFGSLMLFAAEDFRQRVDWDYLGSCLAEDFHLGRLLSPVRLSSARLTTLPASESWGGALRHYLRWQKTVAWCRPGPYAAQILVLPVVGWTLALLLSPPTAFPGLLAGLLSGLLAVLAIDTVAAWAICRALGCRLGPKLLAAVPVWSLARGAAWVACWLPLPVTWRDQRWWGPYRSLDARQKLLESGSQPGLDG